jgi:hypothetical protein
MNARSRIIPIASCGLLLISMSAARFADAARAPVANTNHSRGETAETT